MNRTMKWMVMSVLAGMAATAEAEIGKVTVTHSALTGIGEEQEVMLNLRK